MSSGTGQQTVPKGSNIIHSFLGKDGSLLATNRTAVEIATNSKLFPKGGRADLLKSDPKSYYRMVDRCCKGIEFKFDLLEPLKESDTERLKQSYNVDLRKKEIKKALEEDDMEDVFNIPLSFDSNGVPTSSESVNILETIHGVSLETIKKSSELYALKSSQSYHPQNIIWSGKKVLNSCTSALREKVLEAAESEPEEIRGGPLYYYLMHKLIISTSEKAMRGLTSRLTNMKLSSFDGENVFQAGSFVKSALNLLRTHERLPNDVKLIIFNIFRQCSSPEFVKFVELLESLCDESNPLFSGPTSTRSPEDIIVAFENKYSELIGRDQWVAKSPTVDQKSAFLGSTSVVCFNCGEIGHVVSQCPQPHDESKIKIRKDLFQKGKSKSDDKKPTKGNGKSKNNKSKNNNKAKGKEKENSNLKSPPKPGESHKKTINGKTLHWCGKCAKWTDHNTSDHPDGNNQSSEDNNGAEQDPTASSAELAVLHGAMAQNFL